MRFARATEHVWGHKLFSRREVGATPDLDAGAFLARLWALFGPPAACDDGFEYSLVDGETGLAFTAYSAASGPSYGGHDAAALRPVIVALEALLAETQPIECEHAYTLDVDYGGGTRVIGWREGASFAEMRDSRTPPSAATSYEECVAIAAEYEGNYRAIAGWHECLARVLPEPPESITWRGRRYDECIGFSIEANVPSMLYIHGDESPRPIPLADLELALPPLAQLWLDAFERWKREQPTKQAHKKKSRRGG